MSADCDRLADFQLVDGSPNIENAVSTIEVRGREDTMSAQHDLGVVASRRLGARYLEGWL